MGSSSTVTAQQYLEQCAAQMDEADLFFGHGTDNSWDEACWLLETLLKRSGIVDIHPDLEIPAAILADANQLLAQRLASRPPMAYLLNEAWFCGVPFFVDERVLVPRSPIAELIETEFETLIAASPRRILDMCAGGGCIGIACAMAFPEAEVVLADISPDALAVSQTNVARYDLESRVTLVQSDLFAGVEGQFDLIVTNPPYVAQGEYDGLPDEFKREPVLGLVTENEGLAIPLRILAQAADYLTPGGVLVLETGATWELLAATRPDLPFLWLEFANGGEGVCVLTREQLLQAR